jgi:hypothetical protein
VNDRELAAARKEYAVFNRIQRAVNNPLIDDDEPEEDEPEPTIEERKLTIDDLFTVVMALPEADRRELMKKYQGAMHT